MIWWFIDVVDGYRGWNRFRLGFGPWQQIEDGVCRPVCDEFERDAVLPRLPHVLVLRLGSPHESSLLVCGNRWRCLAVPRAHGHVHQGAGFEVREGPLFADARDDVHHVVHASDLYLRG